MGLRRWGMRLFALLAVLLMAGPALAQTGDPVRVSETRETFTMSNGIVTATVSKRTGDLLSLIYKGTETLEKDSGGHSGGYWSHDTTGGKETITRISIDPAFNGGARAEVSVKGISGGIKMGHGPGTPPDGDAQVDIDIRYALGRGEPGVYTYSIFDHLPEYDAGFLGEARYAVKLGKFFDHIHVDGERSGKYPLLGEGIDKYTYTALQWEERAFGWTSPERKLGWFLLNPSAEYLSGGPTKAEFLAHGTATVLNYWKSSHYGGASVNFAKGESWKKVIGPFFFYINEGASSEAMLADAKAQLAREEKKWPYGWVEGGDYKHADERKTVKGRFQLKDAVARGRFPGKMTVGLATPPYEADTILGRRTISWDNDGKYYQFWNRITSPDGSFTVPNVAPGKYRLYAYAEGVLGDYASADLVIPEGGGTMDLGTLVWEPRRNGRQLWDVGTADHSGGEFAYAKRYFMPGVQMRYPEMFPNGTTYRIGQSTPAKDWFFAHTPNTKGQKADISPFRGVLGTGPATPYRILFPLKKAGKGTATLRVAVTATGASTLDIAVNGQSVGPLKLGRPDGALTRHQIYGKWYEVELPFDGSLLKKGENELVVTVPAGSFNAGVVYDYLRLELDEAKAFAATQSAEAPVPPAAAAPPVAPPASAAKREAWTAPMQASVRMGQAQFRTEAKQGGNLRLLAQDWGGKRGTTDLVETVGLSGTLTDWAVSRDGNRVAIAVAGEDGLQTVGVVDAARGALPDRIRWVRNSAIQWTPEGDAFYYSGETEPSPDPFIREFGGFHALYLHRVGTEQSADKIIYSSDRGRTSQKGVLSSDGRWMVVTSSLPDEVGDSVVLIDRHDPHSGPWQLVATFTDRWRYAGDDGSIFYFVTEAGAPRRRLVAFDLASNSNLPVEVVGEAADPLIGAHLTDGKIVLDYQNGRPAASRPSSSRAKAGRCAVRGRCQNQMHLLVLSKQMHRPVRSSG